MPSKKLNFRDSTGISEEERKVVKNSFACLLCPETFSHESTLKRHAKLHSKRALFSCDVCFRNFNKKTQLKLHKKVHTRKKSYQCSICNESFTNSSNLSSHLQTHNSKNLFECTVCGKCFTNRYTLKRHMKTHPLHNNPTQDGKNIFKKSINCALCTKTFTHERGLKQHKKLHNKESPVMCDVCFKGFSLKLDLNSHMKVHTADKYHQCKICSKNFLHITTLSEHTQNHKDTQFKCTMCEKCFKRRDLLKLHMKVHPSAIMDRTREHNLEVADLNKPSELLFRKEKENKLPIQLKNANISKQNRKMKLFPRPNLRHRGISHSQEKPFKCHVCLKGFYRRCNLKLHMKTHSDDKLQMKVQTSSTWAASSQQNHSLQVSNSNNSKSLINDEADEDDVPLISLLHFPSRNISKQNMVKDKDPSIFNLFPKSSLYKHSLKQQRKSQSTERPFTCNICFKGFQQNTKLKVHMKEHSGEKPFQCKTNSDKENRYIKPSLESVEYEKSFIKSSQLKHDMKRHIPSESCITYDYLESNPSNFESLGKELTVDEEKSPAIECVDLLSSKPPNLEQEKIASKSFSCNLCSKTFSLKSTLRKSHSNGRPFTWKEELKRIMNPENRPTMIMTKL
ncbi:uncharacterized protein [Leptinotarsa decemlineata]|uniref:uncharacterized protein n=1 Tax=Leptinotarsa decemlineata TaxID=7539 RepID=UPI003D30AB49